MTDDSSPLVVTLKGGGGYDAPWLVIRGTNPQQVAEMLRNLGDLPEVIAQQASLFTGTVSAGGVLQQPAPQQQAPPQPAWGSVTPQGFAPAQQGQQRSQQQAAPQAPQGPERHPEGLLCQLCNGFVVKKVVQRKSDNKEFKFWTCVNQAKRDDGHFSEFA